MNKDEILAKSREENEISDERTRWIKKEGANFSIGVLIFLWFVLTKFAPLDPTGRVALGLLVHVTCFSNFAYQWGKSRTKTALFFTIAFTATSAFYVYRFFHETGIW